MKRLLVVLVCLMAVFCAVSASANAGTQTGAARKLTSDDIVEVVRYRAEDGPKVNICFTLRSDMTYRLVPSEIPEIADEASGILLRAMTNAEKMKNDCIRLEHEKIDPLCGSGWTLDYKYSGAFIRYILTDNSGTHESDSGEATFTVTGGASLSIEPHVIYELSEHPMITQDFHWMFSPKLDYTHCQAIAEFRDQGWGEDAVTAAFSSIVYCDSLMQAAGSSVEDYISAHAQDVNSRGKDIHADPAEMTAARAKAQDDGIVYTGVSFRMAGWMKSVIGRYEILAASAAPSGMEAAAFLSPDRRICYIAYRGTEPSQYLNLFGDLRTDLMMALGEKLLKQFDDAAIFYDRVQRLVGNETDIRLTGHSLGGSLAAYTGLLNRKPSNVINGAVGYMMKTLFTQPYSPGWARIYNTFEGLDTTLIYNRLTRGGNSLAEVLSLNELIAHTYRTSTSGMIIPHGTMGTDAHNIFSQFRLDWDTYGITGTDTDITYFSSEPMKFTSVTNGRYSYVGNQWYDEMKAGELLGAVRRWVIPSAFMSFSFYAGKGRSDFEGALGDDYFYAGKDDIQALYGLEGNDTYIIPTGTETVEIYDTSGKNHIILLDGAKILETYGNTENGQLSRILKLTTGVTVRLNGYFTNTGAVSFTVLDQELNRMTTFEADGEKKGAVTLSASGKASPSHNAVITVVGEEEIRCTVYQEEGDPCGEFSGSNNWRLLTDTGYYDGTYPDGLMLITSGDELRYSFESSGSMDITIGELSADDRILAVHSAEGVTLSEGNTVDVRFDGTEAMLMNADRKPIGALTLKEYVYPTAISVTVTSDDTTCFDGESACLRPSETLRLCTTLSPQNVITDLLYYESSAPQVATVSSEGVIYGISAGSAVITVYSAASPEVRFTYYVEVAQEPDTQVGIKQFAVCDGSLHAEITGGAGKGLCVFAAAYDKSGRLLGMCELHREQAEKWYGSLDAPIGSSLRLFVLDKLQQTPLCECAALPCAAGG